MATVVRTYTALGVGVEESVEEIHQRIDREQEEFLEWLDDEEIDYDF